MTRASISILLCSLVAFVSLSSAAWGGGHGCGCPSHVRCEPVRCEPTYVEKTIHVPRMFTEKRTITVTECRQEVRQRVVTDFRMVPEVRQVTRQHTILVPQQEIRTVPYTVCKPVYKDVRQERTIMVPHEEVRRGTKTVCRLEPVQVKRTVCRDAGHWEERPCQASCSPCGGRRCGRCCGGCGGCGDAPRTCKVWVPNVVEEEVEVTVHREVQVEVPYEYAVTVYKPQRQERTIRVCEYDYETKTREVPCTIHVPKVVEKTYDVTTYRREEFQRTISYTVDVPHPVEKEIEVQVCRMVPKTIQVPVYPRCCGSCGCR